MNVLRKDRIEKRLVEMGKNKSWLSQQMNMSLQSFSRMLGENNNPRIDNIIELSKLLNVSCDYLLGLSNESEIDVSLKDISKKTGLSLKSLKTLQILSDLNLINSINELFECIYSYDFYSQVESFFKSFSKKKEK